MSRNDDAPDAILEAREAYVLLVRLSAAELATLRHGTAEKAGAEALVATWRHAESAAENPDICELEGAFAGVHFLLTGADAGGDGPLAFIAGDATGERLPTTFAGLAGRVFEPDAVAAIADAIESLPARSVRQRLASDALAAVTPFAGRPLDDEDKEWLLAVLQALMVFVRRAATDRVPLLVARIE